MTQEPAPGTEPKPEEPVVEQVKTEQPAEPVGETPPAETTAVAPAETPEDEEPDWDDSVPITKEDWVNLGRYVFSAITTGIKRPIRRAGRAYMTSAERAADEILHLGEKKGKQ